jgi:4-hydroxy-tetrahydrodipicolinate synthase
VANADAPTEPGEGRDRSTFEGIYPAALTMFDRRGALDPAVTARHLERLIAAGAHGVVVGGTSGEFIAMEADERRRLLDVAVEAVAGRVPVVAGTGLFSTAATIELTRHAEAARADAALVILPYYQRPMLAEVRRHFAEVAAATRLPVLAYNNPGNSAAPALSPRDLAGLYRAGAVVGTKSTFPTVHEIHELRAAAGPGFAAFYGSFMAPLEGLAAGADGWISGILNVVTADAVELWNAIRRSDLPAARVAWQRILPIKLLWTEQRLGAVSDLSIYRAMLDLRGEGGGWSRPPTLPLDRGQRRRLERLLAEAGP